MMGVATKKTGRKSVVYLSEYSECFISDFHLTEDERAYLTMLTEGKNKEASKVRFAFDELRTGVRFRSYSWVGVIELENLRLVITPKFHRAFQGLIDMICFVEQLPFYDWRDAEAAFGTKDFMELFVRLYLIEVEKLLDIGLIKEYVTEEENLYQMRGRPDFIKNLKHNYTFSHKLYCHYDELVTNVPENQVIRKGLELAHQFPLLKDTKKRLNRLRSEIEQWCESYSGNEFPEFSYHRLNAHYERTHQLTAYLFQNLSVKNIYRFYNKSFFHLLIDMNVLFERFVITLLKRYLPERYHVKSSPRVKKAITLNGKSYRDVEPDVVITDCHLGRKLVLDMKYKNYAERDVATSDIFQLAFYAQYYHENIDIPHRSVIVYPRFKDTTPEQITINLLPQSTYQGILKVHPLSIEESLAMIKTSDHKRLEEKLSVLVR